MNPKTVTELDVVPMVSLEDCRKHLRITDDEGSPPYHPDDELVLSLLGAAREWVEGYTGLALIPRTLVLAIDAFPAQEILLPQAPVTGVVSVIYIDGDEVQQEVPSTDYMLDEYQRPGWLLPAYGKTWPVALDVVNAVLIRYTVGYSLWSGTQTLPLPKVLRSATLLLLGALYENREDSAPVQMQEVPFGVKSLCDWVRIRKGMA